MDWKIEGSGLIKEFTFKNFVESVDFANSIVPIAEEMDHHPDLLIHSYKKVKVILFTHSENKITQKDYTLAEKIDNIIRGRQ